MKQIIMIMIIAVCFVCCIASNKSFFNVPVIPVDHQKCETSSECILIQLDCSDCDCGLPINKKYKDLYSNEKKKRCADYQEPVCDIVCPETELICQDGLCAEILKP